jgi:hypothetical protein
VRLPQFTNREDFYQSISFFDEMTGDPMNISGTILANPGLPFSINAWTVTDGPIATTSSTSLTIPVPPIGNQLSALTLVVGTGLTIAAGDPVKIADTATGLNQMLGYVTGYSPTTGTLTCQIGWTFQFEIRGDPPNSISGAYVSWFDFGTPSDTGPILAASLANYIAITDIGYILIEIPERIFKGVLDAPYNAVSGSFTRTLMAAITMTDSVHTKQLYRGRLSILYGGVSN